MREGLASRTAEYVALFRAIESSLPSDRRLFEDSFARQFLSPRFTLLVAACRIPGVADIVSRYIDARWAGARSSAVARTRFIDDVLKASLEQGIEQVVILGAGFDSRAYRLRGLSRVVVFEVDHPDTLAKKRSVLGHASAGVASDHHFVAVDFNSGALGRVMAEAGYSTRLRTFFLWEGVTNYLTEGAVDETLKWCARAAPGSRVLFTYVHRAVLDHPETFAGTERLFATLRASGEEWKFGLDPSGLEAFLRERGLELDRDVGSADYRARYWPQLSRTMRGYEFYRIAVATVP